MLASFLSAYVLINKIPILFECMRNYCDLLETYHTLLKGHDAVKYANEHSRDTGDEEL
jgi:hypothetical protein